MTDDERYYVAGDDPSCSTSSTATTVAHVIVFFTNTTPGIPRSVHFVRRCRDAIWTMVFEHRRKEFGEHFVFAEGEDQAPVDILREFKQGLWYEPALRWYACCDSDGSDDRLPSSPTRT